jgi:D-beta-D-heptose 7-phosphate kinase/D-beta-D-heptose 1-phosphate adenosyltransferase
MVKLAGTLSHFQEIRALVIGDYLLDTYTTGRVKRVSPEAPVPVLEVVSREARAGGAGNVVLSLMALGAEVVAVGRVGADAEGDELKESLKKEGVDLEGLLVEEHYRTPVKNRLIANSQQLLRVDREIIAPISPLFEAKVLEFVTLWIQKADVIAFSDYAKGFLTPTLLSSIISLARAAKVPVIVDPKGLDFQRYRGATVLKPNLGEAFAAASLSTEHSLDLAARRLIDLCDIDTLLVTRGEEGISLFNRSYLRTDFPVRSREVKDVTGAGDTVLAVISAGMANGLDLPSAVELANIAAGIAIERLGCIQVTLSELAERLLTLDANTKVFDDSHTFALRQVLKNKSYTLFVLPQGQQMSNALFRALQRLKKEKEELVIYVQGAFPEDEFIHLLSSLSEVSYIILQKESVESLCEALQPQAVYVLKQDELHREAKNILASLRQCSFI